MISWNRFKYEFIKPKHSFISILKSLGISHPASTKKRTFWCSIVTRGRCSRSQQEFYKSHKPIFYLQYNTDFFFFNVWTEKIYQFKKK